MNSRRPLALVLGALTVALLSASSSASACDKHKGGGFSKSDTNADGFLTAAEVGDKRWEHIKVADANSDGKISKAEFKQAKKDGKLGKKKKTAEA